MVFSLFNSFERELEAFGEVGVWRGTARGGASNVWSLVF